MVTDRTIKKIKTQLPEFHLSARLAQEYKEDVRDAQAYLALIKQLSGCEKQFTWNRLKAVYGAAEELMTNAASNLIKAASLPVEEEPMAQLTWRENVALKMKDFKIAKTLFNFTVERLRIRKAS